MLLNHIPCARLFIHINIKFGLFLYIFQNIVFLSFYFVCLPSDFIVCLCYSDFMLVCLIFVCTQVYFCTIFASFYLVCLLFSLMEYMSVYPQCVSLCLLLYLYSVLPRFCAHMLNLVSFFVSVPPYSCSCESLFMCSVLFYGCVCLCLGVYMCVCVDTNPSACNFVCVCVLTCVRAWEVYICGFVECLCVYFCMNYLQTHCCMCVYVCVCVHMQYTVRYTDTEIAFISDITGYHAYCATLTIMGCSLFCHDVPWYGMGGGKGSGCVLACASVREVCVCLGECCRESVSGLCVCVLSRRLCGGWACVSAQTCELIISA